MKPTDIMIFSNDGSGNTWDRQDLQLLVDGLQSSLSSAVMDGGRMSKHRRDNDLSFCKHQILYAKTALEALAGAVNGPPTNQWTLISPDGGRWYGETKLKCMMAETNDRIPAKVQLERIFAGIDRDDIFDELVVELRKCIPLIVGEVPMTTVALLAKIKESETQ